MLKQEDGKWLLSAPVADEDVMQLKAGERVFLSGKIYTGRDAAHKRLIESLNRGEASPFDLQGQIIYYVGPSPTKPGQAIGACGPTTSYRMDAYAPLLIEKGLKVMIGKGMRAQTVKDAMRKHKAAYLAATGGAGALLAKAVKEARVIAYDDLGPEAIRELVVENLPAIVINDVFGADLYEMGVKAYRLAV